MVCELHPRVIPGGFFDILSMTRGDGNRTEKIELLRHVEFDGCWVACFGALMLILAEMPVKDSGRPEHYDTARGYCNFLTSFWVPGDSLAFIADEE